MTVKRVFEVKWFKENGFFSEEGQHAMMHFKDGLNDIMWKDEIHEMSISQLQTLKANMYKMVGDAIADALAVKRARIAKFAAMSDEEFYNLLDERHGADLWPNTNGSLNHEEEDRLPQSKIRELQEKDFLDEIVDERTAKNPKFPKLMKTKKK